MKRTRIIFWLALAVLLLINAYILLHRNEGYKYFPFKTYGELYVTDSTLYLKDVNFNKDTLELSFSRRLASNYNLIIDDTMPRGTIKADNKSLHIPLLDDIHSYKLIPSFPEALQIVIEIDHDKNEGANYTNEFVYCNVPGPNIKVSRYKTWTKGIISFSDDEVRNGKELLTKNTAALSASTDSARLIEVCRLISILRPNANGIKASEVSLESPYKQLKMAMQNKINLDCGNYAVMLHYLCSVLDLPNRVITFSGPAGNWQYGVHYYNEIYLREKQQWVLCDGLSNGYMPHDSIRFYNAADVYKMAHVNSFKNKYAYTFEGNSLKKVSYDSLSYWHWYYNRNNANLCYLHPGTGVQGGKWNYFKDFYSFNRNFDFYSDVNENDWMKIIIKMISFYLMLIVAINYILWELKTLVNSRKRPTAV